MIKALGALAVLAIATPALASDLPSKKAPPAFAYPVAAAPADATGWYGALDAGVGYSVNSEKFKGTLGARGGYDFGPVRLEADYSRYGIRSGGANEFTGNVILQHRLGDFTPYVLGGGGIALVDSDFRFRDSLAVYRVGGGVRYSLAKFGLDRVELDARYVHSGAAQFAHATTD